MAAPVVAATAQKPAGVVGGAQYYKDCGEAAKHLRSAIKVLKVNKIDDAFVSLRAVMSTLEPYAQQ